MDSANQGNCWLSDEIIRKEKEKAKIPIQCRICEYFMDDIHHSTQYFCVWDDVERELEKSCGEFKFGKWALVDFLEEKFGSKLGGKKS